MPCPISSICDHGMLKMKGNYKCVNYLTNYVPNEHAEGESQPCNRESKTHTPTCWKWLPSSDGTSLNFEFNSVVLSQYPKGLGHLFTATNEVKFQKWVVS